MKCINYFLTPIKHINMSQRQISFTQHVIESPHIFAQYDSFFICSYKILNKVKIMLENTWLPDENGKFYMIKPKHWIVSTMDRHITNKSEVNKYIENEIGFFQFDYNGNKLTYIKKPADEEFLTEKPNRSKKPKIEANEEFDVKELD